MPALRTYIIEGKIMVSKVVYFCTDCDGCGAKFGKGLATAEDQARAMFEHGWRAIGKEGKVVCPLCIARTRALCIDVNFHTVLHTYKGADTE
jgi:hypothetical protein